MHFDISVMAVRLGSSSSANTPTRQIEQKQSELSGDHCPFSYSRTRGRRKCDKIPVEMRLHFRSRKKSGAMEMPLPPPPTIRLTLIRQLFIRSFSYLTQTQYGITNCFKLTFDQYNYRYPARCTIRSL